MHSYQWRTRYAGLLAIAMVSACASDDGRVTQTDPGGAGNGPGIGAGGSVGTQPVSASGGTNTGTTHSEIGGMAATTTNGVTTGGSATPTSTVAIGSGGSNPGYTSAGNGGTPAADTISGRSGAVGTSVGGTRAIASGGTYSAESASRAGSTNIGGRSTTVGQSGSGGNGGINASPTGGKLSAGGTAGGTADGTRGGSATGGRTQQTTGGAPPSGLGWPIDCVLGRDCSVGYPDIDDDGQAFDCSAPGYAGHEGTDIAINWAMMDAGTDVYAAADGDVLWVFDGHYDRCPNSNEPSCQAPSQAAGPNVQSGYMVCTIASDQYCQGTSYTSGCYWCFYGSNVVVIRHDTTVFATRYDHLRRGSIVVAPGQHVARGQKIAEVGSAGNSTGPHLHFEIWVGGFYRLAEPWAGACGPNHGPSLWDPALGIN